MSFIYTNWTKKTPKTPLRDLDRFRVSSIQRDSDYKKFLHSINVMDGTRFYWPVISLVFCWSHPPDIKKKILKELLLRGVDMDDHGACGLTPFHVLLLTVAHGMETIDMLRFWIEKGCDVHKKVFLVNEEEIAIHPLDFYKRALLMRKLLPPVAAAAAAAAATTTTANQDVLRYLERLYGPTRDDDIDRLVVQWKLPYPLSDEDVLTRSRFLREHRDLIETARVLAIRGRDRRVDDIYMNSSFYDNDEFMDYEFVHYYDESSKRRFFFHKTMIPSMLKTGSNPYTKIPIPHKILERWFDEMSERPRVHQLVTLTETIDDDNSDINTAATLRSRLDAGYYFLSNLISPSHPYTNVYNIACMEEYKIRHISIMLTKSPFRYKDFTRVFDAKRDHHRLFLQSCLALLMTPNPTNFLHHVHFVLEECLFDFSMADQVSRLCSHYNVVFNKQSFRTASDTIYELSEILSERLGFYDETGFRNLWNRVVCYHDLRIAH